MAKKIGITGRSATTRKNSGGGGGGDAHPATRGRADKRHQILLYMKPDVIADLKRAALEEDVAAFRLVERVVVAYLAKRKSP